MKNSVLVNTGRKTRKANRAEVQAFNSLAKKRNVNLITKFSAASIEESFKKSTTAAVGIVKETGEKKAVGPVTNTNTGHIALSIIPSLGRKALMETLKVKKSEIGVGKYIGLEKVSSTKMEDQKKFCTDGVEVLVTSLSSDRVAELIDEMKSCDLMDDENIKKIFWDLNVIYRLYQEKIIDAAKKLYKVVIEILIKAYRPMSLQKFDYNFDFSKKEIKLFQNSNTMEGVTLFQDSINEVQVDVADLIEELVTEAFELEVEMSKEEEKRLLGYLGEGPVADLNKTVKSAYAALTGQHQEALKQIKDITDDDNDEMIAIQNKRYSQSLDRLRNLALQLLDGYTDEEAASIMHLIACLDSHNVFDRKSGNQISTSLLPEKFLTMILNNQAEVKVMGYPIAIDMGLNIGDEVEFFNGVCNNGSILDFKNEIEFASGVFKIEEFNGRKYAVKDLQFVAPEADYEKRFFVIKKKSYKDVDMLLDSIKEGSTVVINDLAEVKVRGTKVASIRCEIGYECEKGNTIESLINVRGIVSYLNVVESEKYGDTIMFELSDVVELEEEEDIMPDIEEDLNIEVDGEDEDIEDNLGEPEESYSELDGIEDELDSEDDDLWEDFE